MGNEFEALAEGMTKDEIVDLKAKAETRGNTGLVQVLDNLLNQREAKDKAEAVKAKFESGLPKFVDKLPEPPPEVHNIFLAFREVETEDTSQPQVEVELVNPETHEKYTEMRYPKVKTQKWIAEVNKATTIQSGSGKGKSETKTAKRGITVYKREGMNLQTIGNFKNGETALRFVNLQSGGDSANRVLQRNGYLIEPYEGIDFTEA